jgi:sulfite exporter TauE/SafE/copper chaperone CopZ
MSKKYVFTVEGMTCSHCERAVESSVSKISGVNKVIASATKGRVEVIASPDTRPEAITSAIGEAGYIVKGHTESDASDDEKESGKRFSPAQFLGIAAVAAAFFFLLHNTIGFSNIPAIPSEATYGLLFVAGLFTSLHCVAMCGGIAFSQCLGVSGTCATRFSGIIPSSLYNGGRVVSYAITGAVAGALGSAISFSPSAKSGIMIGAGIIMILMGLKYLGIVNLLPRVRIPLPSFLSRQRTGKYSPLVVGLLNGLMPCGPLQAMQLFALGTGSALHGALAMTVFALGTVPLLFILGAASTFISRRFTAMMFRTSGAILILLACVMISQGLTISGTPVFAAVKQEGGAAVAVVANGVQSVTSTITAGSYQPIIVQKGIPVRWTIKARAADLNGCNNAIVIPKFGIQKKLVPGNNVIEFTPDRDGIIGFSCWMGMIPGTISVVSDIKTTKSGDIASSVEQTSPRGCGGIGINGTGGNGRSCCGGRGKLR